ncbi:TIR domain-containing protein [Sorangium atrum]|uniref:TIR domain-containing protein n=2 Tax=Sorangium atrum TaxID=2995308 RepID=A0ABT5CHS4_9BACT|nr:TIR domain-containing protein [Sorangium aterium]MDC0685947.1 TIR domain-containing protein [Sorangium aterium]
MTRSDGRPVRVLISFSPADRALEEQLVRHLHVLVRFAGIDLWTADRVGAGEDWREAFDAALERADVALLLMSADFLASDLVQDVEMPKLLRRREEGGLKVIPVLLRSCLWHAHPWLGGLSPLPGGDRAIASLQEDDRDRALMGIAAEVARCSGALSSPGPLDDVLATGRDAALPRAADNEILVLVAQFASATPDRIHVEERISRALSRAKERLPGVPFRIERLRDVTIGDGDEAGAARILARCNARLLIWGHYDAIGFAPRLLVDPAAVLESAVPVFDEVLRDDADASFRRYILRGLGDDLRTWALLVIGELLYWGRRFDDAMTAIDLALADWDARPDEPDAELQARVARGLFYKGVVAGTQRGDVAAAAACFRRALELRPAAYVAAYNLGDALYNLGDHEGAIRAYTTVMDTGGAHYPSLVGRGHARYELGRFREAVEDYTAALGLMTSADVLLARSRAFQKLGQARFALGDYALAKEVDPLASLAWDYLDASLFPSLGKSERADAHFAPFGDGSPAEVTFFSDPARRFLGRPAPPLGTRGKLVDPAVDAVAGALSDLYRSTGIFKEGTPTYVENGRMSAGHDFLRAFAGGLPDPEGVLRTVVTLVRFGVRRPLSALVELPDVRARLAPRLSAALDVLLTRDAAYLHAMAITGCDPVDWIGDEARHVPLCEAVAERIRALEGDTHDYTVKTRLRDKTIMDVLFGLGPPDGGFSSMSFKRDDAANLGVSYRQSRGERVQRTWHERDVDRIARGRARRQMARIGDDAAFWRRVDDLLGFLVENAILPARVRQRIAEAWHN